MPIRGRYSPFNLTAFNKRLDHGLLLGLTNDNHPQYWADTTIGTRSTNYSTTGRVTAGSLLLNLTHPYLFTEDDQGTPMLAIQNQDDVTTRLGLFKDSATIAGDATDNISIDIYGLGTPTTTADHEKLQMGWNRTAGCYQIRTAQAGSGAARALEIGIEGNADMMLFNTDTSIDTNTLLFTVSGPAGIDGRLQLATSPANVVWELDSTDQRLELTGTVDVLEYFIDMPVTVNNTIDSGAITSSGASTFNSGSVDADFTVNWNTGVGLFVEGSSGRVGIGTTTPDYILDINAGEIADNNYDGVRIIDTGWDATSHPMLEFYNSHASFGGPLVRIYGEIGSIGENSKLYFAVADSSKNLQDRMVIDSAGNVGIGLTTVNANYKLIIRRAANVNLGIGLQETELAIAAFNDALSANIPLRFYASEYNLLNGNVGINTTTPISKLSINGGLHVGGDSDAGDNNLLVDGTVGCGAITCTALDATAGLIQTTGNGLFGASLIRNWPTISTYATFSNNSLTATANAYCLMQSPAGKTFLNSASGQEISFRSNNTQTAVLTPGGIFGVFGSGAGAGTSAQILWNRTKSGGVLSDNDRVGSFGFQGHDGTDAQTVGATLTVNVDGAVATNSVPMEFVFEVMKPTETSRTQAMIIRSSGSVGIGTETPDTTLQVVGTAGFGDDAGNETLIEADGTLKFNGTATVFDDMRIIPGSFDRPGVSDPAYIAYDVNGGGTVTYLTEWAKNDIASFTVQLPHSYHQGENLDVHLHWTPGPNGAGENGATVGWKVQYSWANVDGTFGNMLTADLSDACDGTDHKHQKTPTVVVAGSGKTISSALICNIIRTDTGADDTWAGSSAGNLPMLLEVDFHFPLDTVGSRGIVTK